MLPIASTPSWYFLWHVAVVIAAAHPCAGGQSRSMFAGALQGEIYGEGEQYGHKGDIGAPLLYDGNIHTYFDCLGPGNLGASGCYGGITLAAPSRVARVRVYPRGKCVGCPVAGCHGDPNMGACRMLGARFQGASTQAGPYTTLARPIKPKPRLGLC